MGHGRKPALWKRQKAESYGRRARLAICTELHRRLELRSGIDSLERRRITRAEHKSRKAQGAGTPRLPKHHGEKIWGNSANPFVILIPTTTDYRG